MGWTGTNYTESSHTNWTLELAKIFAEDEFNSSNYNIEKMHFVKSNTEDRHHELYLLMNHPDDYKFAMVVIVDIINSEILWKEMDETMGPAYHNCPIEFISELPATTYEYAIAWRNECLNNAVSK